MAKGRAGRVEEGTFRRIARATVAVENSGRNMPPIHFRQVDDGGPDPRLGFISSTWTVDTTATVTRLKPDGTAWPTTETFEALNHFATIPVTSGTKKVLCVYVHPAWLLVAGRC
jgi:hypothetical protein